MRPGGQPGQPSPDVARSPAQADMLLEGEARLLIPTEVEEFVTSEKKQAGTEPRIIVPAGAGVSAPGERATEPGPERERGGPTASNKTGEEDA